MTKMAISATSNSLSVSDAPVISIVVPVRDEEDGIGPFVKRLSRTLDQLEIGGLWEILFVDDGSRDGTVAAVTIAHAQDPRIRALSLSRNFGKEAAISAGLEYARGQAVVPMDVDMQDPPEVLVEMVEKWRQGYEMVIGVRRNRASDSIQKRVTAALFYNTHNFLSKEKIPANAGDFRLLDRRVVDAVRALPERNRFMKGLFAWAGFRQAIVEYDRAERNEGASRFGYWNLWTLALDGITAASTVPLRVWSYVGALIAFFSMCYAIFIAGRTMIFGVDVPGYASIMVSVLFLGGIQLISLGILGEYVGRVLTEAKQRPLYVVRCKVGFDDE